MSYPGRERSRERESGNPLLQEKIVCVMEVLGDCVGLVVEIEMMMMTVKLILCVERIIAGGSSRTILGVRKHQIR